MLFKIASLSIFLAISSTVCCQRCESLSIHSHNDYQHEVPFWEAYEAGATSIEVDVFLKNDTLFVTHTEADIEPWKDIESLYLLPIRKVLGDSFGFNDHKIQLLIDIKSDTYATLDKLVEILENYPDITTNQRMTIAVSGNRPKIDEYGNYPDYVFFDYQSLDVLANKDMWKKIALISLPFYKYSSWDGHSNLTEKKIAEIKAVIEQANNFGKPFRFWATPDTQLSWKTLTNLGICFINTDRPSECAQYLKELKKGHH